METLASKTMLKRGLVRDSSVSTARPSVSARNFYTKSGTGTSGSLISYLKNTYSEAMLISGASKQISCAIFYIFDLIIY